MRVGLGERVREHAYGLSVGAVRVQQVARQQDELRALRLCQCGKTAQKLALLTPPLRCQRAGERLKRGVQVQIRRVQEFYALHRTRTASAEMHLPLSLSISKIAPSSLQAPIAAS